MFTILLLNSLPLIIIHVTHGLRWPFAWPAQPFPTNHTRTSPDIPILKHLLKLYPRVYNSYSRATYKMQPVMLCNIKLYPSPFHPFQQSVDTFLTLIAIPVNICDASEFSIYLEIVSHKPKLQLLKYVRVLVLVITLGNSIGFFFPGQIKWSFTNNVCSLLLNQFSIHTTTVPFSPQS